MRALGAGLLLVAVACTQKSSSRADAFALVDATPAPVRAVALYPAVRCAECHGKMYDEWSGSAHARAQSSPLFVAMRARVDARTCEPCHAPMASHADPTDPAGQEGVSCETCHRMVDASPRREGASFKLELTDTVKYGPLCDAKNHYFHKMGCSPLHEEARLCAACHLWFEPRPSGVAVPVYTEYEEWSSGPYASQNVDCQDCHMPGEVAEVAAGSHERIGVPHHGLLARDGKLRKRALALAVAVRDDQGRIHVEATVTNVGAGHAVPSGLPGRQVVLRVRTLDGHGTEVARAERTYQRLLSDGGDGEVPFFAATRVGSDNRLQPKQAHVESFDLAAPGAGELRVELFWRALSPGLASQLGVAPEEVALLATRVPYGPPGASGRRSLPGRPIQVRP